MAVFLMMLPFYSAPFLKGGTISIKKKGENKEWQFCFPFSDAFFFVTLLG